MSASDLRQRILEPEDIDDPALAKEKQPAKAQKVETSANPPPRRSLWPVFAGAAAVIVIGAIVFSRGKREKNQPLVEAIVEAPKGPAINVEAILARFAPGGKLQMSDAPVHLPKDLVVINAKTQTAALREELETRLREVSLPEGGALALRPEKDFVAKIGEDFALLPSVVFDLEAIRSQIERVIAEEEKSVREREAELAQLTAKEKDLVTGPQSDKDEKWTERLKVLKLAVPQDLKELADLRAKAETTPKDVRQIGTYSLFLCQKDVTREIVRFDEEPELVRVASP